MPIALAFAGIVLLIAAVRNTLTDSDKGKGLFTLLKEDFTGPGNFFTWILAIGMVGAVGYIKELKPISNAFLVLLLVIFLLTANKGGKDFITSLKNQILDTQNKSSQTTETSVGGTHNYADLTKAW